MVVAEMVWGGSTDAQVNRVLKAVRELDVADQATGRTAGRLLGTVRSTATVDAIVVATAIERGVGPSSPRRRTTSGPGTSS